MFDEDAFDDLALPAALGPRDRAGRDVAPPVPAARPAAGPVSRPARRALGPMIDQMRAFAAPPIGPTDGVLVLADARRRQRRPEHGRSRAATATYYDQASAHRRSRPDQVLPLTASTGLHPTLTRDQGACTTRGRSRSCGASATGPPTSATSRRWASG